MKPLVLLGAALGVCAGGVYIAADPATKPTAPVNESQKIATLTAERDKAMQMLAAMEKRVAELEKRLNATEAAHKQLSTTHSDLLQRFGASGAAAAPAAPAVTSPGSQMMRRVDDHTWATPDGTTYTILPGGEVIRTDP